MYRRFLFQEITKSEINQEVDSFPCTIKLANFTPAYKKGNRSEKSNYQPVSILPNISRVFERCV